MKIFDILKHDQNYTISLRRKFHQIPELAFDEFVTSSLIEKELIKFGFNVTKGIGKTGIVGISDGNKMDPTFLLRFDIDALPVEEQTDLDFKSHNSARMHACGHDGHIAIGLTIAKFISKFRKQINGNFALVFQPAEEIGQGAKAMIKDGLLNLIEADYALAVHLWAEKPFGWVGAKSGPIMAGSSDLFVRVQGKGGHAASPHTAADPINASAQIISALQSIVSRKLDPTDSGVLSITRIAGGSANNVIPSEVEFFGTMRYFSNRSRDTLQTNFQRICQDISSAFGCEAQTKIIPATIAVINNEEVCKSAYRAAQRLELNISVDLAYKTLISEDVAYFLDEVPGAMLLVGAGNCEPGMSYPHHHPKFDIDERSLTLAAALIIQTCEELAGAGD